MNCGNPQCNAVLYSGDMFCGKCGRPVSPAFGAGSGANNGDLFPIFGVTLGETTTNQLARLGERSRTINDRTGKPYECYKINNLDFWYDEAGISSFVYLAKGIYQIPDRWIALGFNWDISYTQWINLLGGLGYVVRVEQHPHVEKYSGHDSFTAKLIAVRQGKIPIEILLGFSYSEGTTTESPGTLYNITVKARKNR
jgi:hypothetical protein